MGLQILQYDTFQKHCRNFLEPAIVHTWRSEQQQNFQKLQQGVKIAISGDMRADSPGKGVGRIHDHFLLKFSL